jgi:NAD(P)H-hydrate epimerase
LPLVVDADALNLLAETPDRRGNWVLTPHPGEAARLLGVANAAIQRDRFAAAQALQARYGGVAVLKGAGTLVQTEGDRPTICTAGNPGMASGGMGDVLTGVIAGLISQKLELPDAARLGVWLHAAAGDRAARNGERGLLASDLMPHLRTLANG